MLRAVLQVTTAAITLGSLVGVGFDASAQLVESANIVIMPSANASVSDRITARISHAQVKCYSATTAVTVLPGGVFEVSYSNVGATDPFFPCTRTFDVDLGVLPQGNYVVVFRVVGVALASAAFSVGAVAIPMIGNLGLLFLALMIAYCAKRYGSHAV